MSEEIWKPIPGFNKYEVSNQGRVRSYQRSKNPRILNPGKTEGYYFVGLCRYGKRKILRVNRLVLEIFVGKSPSSIHQAAHLNGVRDDNRVENLIWATPTENCQHRRLHGTYSMGENNGRAKITEKDIPLIRQRRANDETYSSIAKSYKMSISAIYSICKKENWSHVQ